MSIEFEIRSARREHEAARRNFEDTRTRLLRLEERSGLKKKAIGALCTTLKLVASRYGERLCTCDVPFSLTMEYWLSDYMNPAHEDNEITAIIRREYGKTTYENWQRCFECSHSACEIKLGLEES